MGSLYPAYFSASGVGDCEAMTGGRVVTSGSLSSELSTQNMRTDRSALSSNTAGREGLGGGQVGYHYNKPSVSSAENITALHFATTRV